MGSRGVPDGTIGKEPSCSAEDIRDAGLRYMRCGFDPWVRSPWGRHGNPFQYSCLENPMGRGTWWATLHRVGHNWSILACSCRVSRGPCALVGSHYPLKWIVTHFIHSINSVYMSMLLSQFVPLSPYTTVSASLLSISVSLFLLQIVSSVPFF